jgi:hypothetical protein
LKKNALFLYQYDIRPTLSITSILFMTANVSRALGKSNSSVLCPAKLIIIAPQNNLNATISPALGCLPRRGFTSYTRGDCNPLYVVYASSALII